MKTIDASVMIDMLIAPKFIQHNFDVLNDQLMAPHILICEVLNVLKRHQLSRSLSRADTNSLAAFFSDAPIDFIPTEALRSDIWAMSQNLSPYDAMYVSVAALSKTPLITRDQRLARAAQKHCDVLVL